MDKRRKIDWCGRCLCFVLLLLAFLPAMGRAEMYSFYAVSDNSGQADAVALQLTVEVSEYGSNQVEFRFTNDGAVASSICDIYFDDGTLLGIAQVVNAPASVDPPIQVAFTQDSLETVHPGDLSAPSEIGFETTVGFSADSDNPTAPNGVDNSGDEWVSIIFNLQDGMDFVDVIAALDQAVDVPGGLEGLRIGLHVQSIGTSGDSDAFINNPDPVPVPAALLLGMLGLTAAGLKLRRYA